MVAASVGAGFPDGVGEFVDQAAAGGQFLPQLPASAVAGCLEVFEADAGRGQFRDTATHRNVPWWNTRPTRLSSPIRGRLLSSG